MEQFSLIATKCCLSQDTLVNFIELLYSHLNTSVGEKYLTSTEFFQLFCRLLESAASVKCNLPLANELLTFEIDLIQNVHVSLLYKYFYFMFTNVYLFFAAETCKEWTD